jgi:hypothetical protein
MMASMTVTTTAATTATTMVATTATTTAMMAATTTKTNGRDDYDNDGRDDCDNDGCDDHENHDRDDCDNTATTMAPTTVAWNPTPARAPTMTPCHCYYHLSAPAPKGDCNCRSPEMQELLMNVMIGLW